MVTLIYDGSFSGLLTCIFEVYERKLKDARVIRETLHQPSFFNEDLDIYTDRQKAERVMKGLQKHLSPQGWLEFYACYLSELPKMEEWLLRYAQLVFSVKDAEKAYNDDTVLNVSQTAKKVLHESHRMKGFVRFALTHDNFYYAVISPDFNVIPLIASHFKQRFADQQWLIYDEIRKYGIFYDLKTVTEVQLSIPPAASPNAAILAEPELHYQKLWKEYFISTDIETRKNSKLQLQHMPKRYWKYLTETY